MNHNQLYRKHGYVLLKGYFSSDEFIRMKKSLEFFQKAPEIKFKWMKYFELIDGARTLNRVENLVDFDTHLLEWTRCKEIAAMMEKIGGKEYILFKDKINFKMPKGSGFDPHQDGAAFMKFTQSDLMTLMIPIDECTEENGCFEVYNRYNHEEIITHQNGNLEHLKIPEDSWKKIEMQPGDLLAFSSHLIHRSGVNRSSQSRRSYFLTYSEKEGGDLRKDYFEFKRLSLPPEIERDQSDSYQPWKSKLACKIL